MTERTGKLYEMFLRVLSFFQENKADFDDIPFVERTIADLTAATGKLGELAAEKASNTASSKDATVFRGDARQNLRDALEDIADIWRAVFDEVGGAQNKYRLPRGNNEQTLIATSKAFAADAAADKEIFMQYGLPANFVEDLRERISDFEKAVETAEAAHGERVGTNAAFADQVAIGRKAVEKLDPAVKRKYRGNPRKTAEWTAAAHVERAPQTARKDAPPKN